MLLTSCKVDSTSSLGNAEITAIPVTPNISGEIKPEEHPELQTEPKIILEPEFEERYYNTDNLPVSTYRALLVSASEDDPNLGLSSRNDILIFDELLQTLKTPRGDDINEITRLHDVSTGRELEESIKSAFDGANDDDLNIFFFSGHGFSTSAFSDFSFLLDQGTYSSEKLANILLDIPGRHLIIMNACMSGGLKSVLSNDRFLFISSASSLQFSYSYGGYGENLDYDNDNISFFMVGLSEGLGMKWLNKGFGSRETPPPSEVFADNNRDGVITFNELKNYLKCHWQISEIVQTFPEDSDIPLFSYSEYERRPSVFDVSISRPSTSSFEFEFTMPIMIDNLFAEICFPDSRKITDTGDGGYGVGHTYVPILLEPLENHRYSVQWDAIGEHVYGEALTFDLMIGSPRNRTTYQSWHIFVNEPTETPVIKLIDSRPQPNIIRPGEQEYRIIVEHNYDCLLDVGIYNYSIRVRTLAHNDIAKSFIQGAHANYPENILYNIYYWDGKDDLNNAVSPGSGYEVRVRAYNSFGDHIEVKILPEVQ